MKKLLRLAFCALLIGCGGGHEDAAPYCPADATAFVGPLPDACLTQ